MSEQPQSNLEMTDEEKQGVEMIQYLQCLAGITESDETSLVSWRRFSTWEKDQTRAAYEFMTDLDEEFDN